jgi:hypothetical protein
MEAGPRDRSPRDRHHPANDEPRDLGEPAGDDAAALEAAHPHDALDGDPLGAEALDDRSFSELRPAPRLRFWQLIPIVAFGALGSLMFAFPLAFEFGDGGPVVAMLGLLLSCCAAGWAVMAARRAGYTWPGLPARGSGDRPDWRFVAGYTAFAALIALLAVWRVARLR